MLTSSKPILVAFSHLVKPEIDVAGADIEDTQIQEFGMEWYWR